MTDMELVEEIERHLAPDAIYWHWEPSMADMEQIIAALRRGPERPPSGEMIHGTYECPICGKDYPHSVLTHAIDTSEKEATWRRKFERFYPEAQARLRENLINNGYARGIVLCQEHISGWHMREGDDYFSPLATVMWQAWKAALSAAEAEGRKECP